MNKDFRKYVVFWLTQSFSQLGSAMTSFALILWVYSVKHSAMTVSLMSFFNYVPYVVVSLFAGAFVDAHSKKKIMLAADSAAACCTVFVLAMSLSGGLRIWHIYLINGVIGFANAFQSPASGVAMGILVPKEKIANASGMLSFSGNLISVLAPVLAASVYAFGGLKYILIFDFGSFAVAFLVLLCFIRIPEKRSAEKREGSLLSDCREGYAFLQQNRGILIIVLTMAMLNFFSRLTYENILSPMILARSGGNEVALGIVNAAMGIGGVLGGILVSAGKMPKDSLKAIYVSAGLSFLLGDLMMGAGRGVFLWSAAGFMASLPIPFISAGQNVILYRLVPEEMQGRIFSVRNAVQFSSIPVGILLGGFLADYVFEPYMSGGYAGSGILYHIVGSGSGSGMAVMFLCTGILGSLFSFGFYRYLRSHGSLCGPGEKDSGKDSGKI